jgi:hypothetical protein
MRYETTLDSYSLTRAAAAAGGNNFILTEVHSTNEPLDFVSCHHEPKAMQCHADFIRAQAATLQREKDHRDGMVKASSYCRQRRIFQLKKSESKYIKRSSPTRDTTQICAFQSIMNSWKLATISSTQNWVVALRVENG